MYVAFGVLRKVGYLQTIQWAVETRPLVFIPYNLGGLRVFIVTVVGGVPAVYFSLKKSLGLIWIVEVSETAVAHAHNHFIPQDVLGSSISDSPEKSRSVYQLAESTTNRTPFQL